MSFKEIIVFTFILTINCYSSYVLNDLKIVIMNLKANFKHRFQGHHPNFFNTKILSCSYLCVWYNFSCLWLTPFKIQNLNSQERCQNLYLSPTKLSISPKDCCQKIVVIFPLESDSLIIYSMVLLEFRKILHQSQI